MRACHGALPSRDETVARYLSRDGSKDWERVSRREVLGKNLTVELGVVGNELRTFSLEEVHLKEISDNVCRDRPIDREVVRDCSKFIMLRRMEGQSNSNECSLKVLVLI